MPQLRQVLVVMMTWLICLGSCHSYCYDYDYCCTFYFFCSLPPHHTHMHACMQTHMCARTHTPRHAHIHTHTCMHTHTHARTHAYTHTHMHTCPYCTFVASSCLKVKLVKAVFWTTTNLVWWYVIMSQGTMQEKNNNYNLKKRGGWGQEVSK